MKHLVSAQRVATWLLLLLPALGQEPEFRIALTPDAASEGVSESDIKAATIAWAETIGAERSLSLHVDVQVFPGAHALDRALREQRVDMATLSTADYLQVDGAKSFDALFVESRNQTLDERYVVLVRRAGPVKTLADLQQQTVLTFTGLRMSLASRWLDQRLTQETGSKRSEWGILLKNETKASACMHKVFFGQAVACLVNARSYATMSELNPQFNRDLVVLAESPSYIPCVIGLRAGYDADIRPDIEQAILEVHRRPRGEQFLRVYKIDQLVALPAGGLESAMALVRETDLATEAHP